MSPYSACVFVGASAGRRQAARRPPPSASASAASARPRAAARVSARRTAAASASRVKRSPPSAASTAASRAAASASSKSVRKGRRNSPAAGSRSSCQPRQFCRRRVPGKTHLAAPVGRREAKALQREREVRLVDHLGRGREDASLQSASHASRGATARAADPRARASRAAPTRRPGAEQHVAARRERPVSASSAWKAACSGSSGFLSSEVDVARKLAVGVRAEPPARGPTDLPEARAGAVELAARAGGSSQELRQLQRAPGGRGALLDRSAPRRRRGGHRKIIAE